ncbi:MAG: hypothetical protein KAU90_01480, partial [Sulfurovaceae bacterium]|nr:hypothetical protein [Sulfurovaceae bacterium]
MKKILLSTVVIGTFAFAGGDIGGETNFIINDDATNADINANSINTNNSINNVVVSTNNTDIDALKQQMSSMQQKIIELENRKPITRTITKEIKIEPKSSKGIVVKSKVPVIKFNGTHYLGFVHTEPESGDGDDKFETRRNYFQSKVYFKENPKDYARVTMDTYTTDEGRTNFTLKYAYLYLDNVLPSTGVEFGQVHRPWIDYEEHNGWLYRSIAKTFLEEHDGAH